jgi:hypothetical protein
MPSTDNYKRALSVLKSLLPEAAMQEFAILEARMFENIHRSRLYGSNSGINAERFEIMDDLNQLAGEYQVKSFTDLCFHPQTINVATEMEQPISSAQAASGSKKIIPPKVDVKLLTRILPTAYYHLLNAQDFPFFRVTIDNTSPDGADASIITSALIEDHSDLAQETTDVGKGEHVDVTLLPTLKHSILTTLTEMRKVTLQISVKQISPEVQDLKNKTESVQLMARNEALIALRGEDKRVLDLTKYLVAWVTPNHPEITRVLRIARDFHPEKRLNGYQDGDAIEETAASVREQVRAIFMALKYRTGLAYASTTLRWEIQPNWITQKVHLPSECLGQGALANCLDGVVLFASLLERISIEPLLVIVPGHAFVGWRVDRGVDRYEFLDTTMIGTDDFEQAQTHATNLYAQAEAYNDFDRELYHQPGFARRIDVMQYRRGGNSTPRIYPLE